MKNYVQEGDVLEVAAPYALSSGDGCLVGLIFGVSVADYLINARAQIKTKGVFDLPKNTGTGSGWAVGVRVWWNPGDKKITDTSDTDTVSIGVATEAASDSATTGRVRLHGAPGAPVA